MATLGGKQVVQGSENSSEIEELGRFAIQQHNVQQNEKGLLSYSRVVKAEQQVVAGTIYHLTIEAKQDGDSSPKFYEAKVWVKPWENFKKLQDFKPVSSPPSITSADLGVKHGLSVQILRRLDDHQINESCSGISIIRPLI